MAERKLNINAPLLSVRRSSAKSPSLTEAKKKILEKRQSLPYKKPVLNLDQVTEPVAVPFNWEHIPGRRKGNGGSESQPPKEASITPSPRLPPGKSTNATKKPLERECKVTNKFRSTNKSKTFNCSVVGLDCDKERKDEKRVSNVNDDDDDDDDDVYSDALDTLSHTESFSMNCSVSGVSGLDNLDAKKSGTFSTDPQTRDFMMSRFLPAAKAMTLQPPQYASRKQSVAVEQPREITKLVGEEKKPSLNIHISDIVPYSEPCQVEESEDEGDDYDYDNTANISAKGCGLFSRLRISNSLCLLNPVPGIKMRNQAPLSTTYEVGKLNKGSHIRSYSPAPAVKKAWDAIYKNKSSSRTASPNREEVRKKWTGESNRFNYSGELQQPGRLSPFRRSIAAAGISPCRSKPQSPLRVARLLGDSKEAENNQAGKLKFQSRVHGNIQEVLSQDAKISPNSGSPTVEKTLYIDTASTVKLSCANSSSVDNTGRNSVVEVLDNIRGKSNISTIKSSQHIKQLEALEQKDLLDSEVLGSIDANSSTLSSVLHLRAQEDKAEGLTINQQINQEYASSQLVQGTANKDSSINTQQIVVFNDSGNGPLPPPLPKSPSESWLWRALPLVSVKNSFLHSNPGTQSHAKRLDSNTTSSTPKWEAIVKTSNLHHDHVRYSQELTTRKSQHSKS